MVLVICILFSVFVIYLTNSFNLDTEASWLYAGDRNESFGWDIDIQKTEGLFWYMISSSHSFILQVTNTRSDRYQLINTVKPYSL